MVPAERFRTVQVYFSPCSRTVQNGSIGIELFRTIPNYLELNSNYFFGGLFYLRTVQNGSSAQKKLHNKVMFFDVKLCFAPVSPISRPQNIPRVNTKHQLKRQKLHRKSSQTTVSQIKTSKRTQFEHSSDIPLFLHVPQNTEAWIQRTLVEIKYECIIYIYIYMSQCNACIRTATPFSFAKGKFGPRCTWKSKFMSQLSVQEIQECIMRQNAECCQYVNIYIYVYIYLYIYI